MSDNVNVKINDPETNFGFSCLQGEIDISYAELVEKLGESSENYDDYKSDAEWDIEFPDGSVASIYNYKDGKNYDGEDGLPTDEIRDWHIGGKDKSIVAKVYEFLEQPMEVDND